ncbi:hypothetical protein OUZ56_009274 [Daphnia magna]|uniref:Uncharacterized protein n=1 Tax=Daphnia magna TaxID=35525 RepID=A0ABR0AFH8_9CRUS|nr:hypothetical protein OUZ56_009274 [Daphnia magna]
MTAPRRMMRRNRKNHAFGLLGGAHYCVCVDYESTTAPPAFYDFLFHLHSACCSDLDSRIEPRGDQFAQPEDRAEQH